MEFRAPSPSRHRKTRSASSCQEIQKHKTGARLSSDSRIHIHGGNRCENMFLPELGQSSLARASGEQVKKLPPSEKTSKEKVSNTAPLNIIAKLMGLERQQPSRQHDHRQQKSLWSDHQEFKDVFEDIEASHIVNRHLSSCASSKFEMSFRDAKRFLNDPYVDPDVSFSNHLAIFRPSKPLKDEGSSKPWKLGARRLKREDGLLLVPQNRHRTYISPNSFKAESGAIKEKTVFPTRIVVLKPNHMSLKNFSRSNSSRDHFHVHPPTSRRTKEWSSDGGEEIINRRRKELATDITRRGRVHRDETKNLKSSRFLECSEYDVSYDASESDSDSDLEMLKLIGRRCPSPTFMESAVNKEAKKRLSERWKMSNSHQDVETANKSRTLGEMLALSDGGKVHTQLNAEKRNGRNNEAENGTSLQSRSFPRSTGSRSPKKSTCHEVSFEDIGTSEVVKGNLCSSGDSKSPSNKRVSHQQMCVQRNDYSSETIFEGALETRTKEISGQVPRLSMGSNVEPCPSPASGSFAIEEHRVASSGLKSSELMARQIFSSLDNDKHASPRQDASSPQKHNLGAEVDSSEISKEAEAEAEADNDSPVSVLEAAYTEQTSSPPKHFAILEAQLHELRIQIQLLKMKSQTSVEASTFIPTDEEVTQLSPTDSPKNNASEAENWEICYALDMLMEYDTFTEWHSPEFLFDHELFRNLEKKYGSKTNSSRSHRRLLFDMINSNIYEATQLQTNLCPLPMPKLSGKQEECVLAAVLRFIDGDFANVVLSEGVLDTEMQWMDLKEEVCIIGREIADLLVDDMIADVFLTF